MKSDRFSILQISAKKAKSIFNSREFVTSFYDNAQADGSSQYLTLQVAAMITKLTADMGAPVKFQVGNDSVDVGWNIYPGEQGDQSIFFYI